VSCVCVHVCVCACACVNVSIRVRVCACVFMCTRESRRIFCDASVTIAQRRSARDLTNLGCPQVPGSIPAETPSTQINMDLST